MLCFCLKGKLHSQTILTSSQQVDWILLCQVKWPLSCCHYLLGIQLVLGHAFLPTEAQKVLSPVIDWQTLQDYRSDAESRATSLQWEEAAQSQTGRYFKAHASGFGPLPRSKAPAAYGHSKFPWSRVTNFACQMFCAFPLCQGSLCLGSIGNCLITENFTGDS